MAALCSLLEIWMFKSWFIYRMCRFIDWLL